MGAGYRVILEDLEQLASTFSGEVGRLEALRSRISPSPPDAGDGTLDAALVAVLETIGTAELALTRSVQDHAEKLRTCHDQYRSVDADVRQLFSRMMDETR